MEGPGLQGWEGEGVAAPLNLGRQLDARPVVDALHHIRQILIGFGDFEELMTQIGAQRRAGAAARLDGPSAKAVRVGFGHYASP